MRRFLLIMVLATLGFGVPLAYAGVSDRLKAAPPGNQGAVFSQSLGVFFTSPPDYRRGCCYDWNGGEWLGPRYEVAGHPNFSGDSSIDWSFGAVKGASAPAVARGSLTTYGSEVESGTVPIAHTVAGRSAGTISGFYVISQFSELAGSARHEAGVSFPMGAGFYGLAEWSLLSPGSDSASPFGDYRVRGMLASQWNRLQAKTAVRGLRLDGSLPPARVRARASGRRIAGEVQDALGHPVAGATVTLERRVGGRWRRAGSGPSGATGGFALRARSAGRYRASARLAGTTVRGAALRVR